MVTIHLNTMEVTKITRWNANNADKRNNCSGKFPYNEFALYIKDERYFQETMYDVKLNNNNIDDGTAYCINSKDEYFFDLSDESEMDRLSEILPENTTSAQAKVLTDIIVNDGKNAKQLTNVWLQTFIKGFMAYVICKSEKSKLEIREERRELKAKTGSNRPANNSNDKVYLLDDIVRYTATHKPTGIKHNITCPAWEVRGYYRHYKSGKTVWVNGYRKGKERNNAVTKNVDIFLKKS